jgi:U3 small nucleolar RNA-associated protein 18
METDGEEMSSQPLARLLQNTGDLIRQDDMAKRPAKRTLRQQVIDIQRLKDVGESQPVSHVSESPHPLTAVAAVG